MANNASGLDLQKAKLPLLLSIFCHSCGRVIGSRRQANAANAANATPVKYCSTRCRSHKPGKLDREIEEAFVQFLAGQEDLGAEVSVISNGTKNGKKKHKGDPRRLVPCSAVEKLVFGHHEKGSDKDDSLSETEELDPQTRQNTAAYHDLDFFGSLDDPAAIVVPQVDGDALARMSVRSGTRIRPPQSVSEVNGSVGGEKGRAERIEETDEMLEKRKKGQKRAKEREMVRCAARRGVVFGLAVKSEGDNSGKRRTTYEIKSEPQEVGRRKCEAVMLGKVVEPSFAKGDWAVRWRE